MPYIHCSVALIIMIGIGTNSPSHKLDVRGSIVMKETLFERLFIRFCKWYFNKKNYNFLLTYPKDVNKASPNDILYINTNGNVGIGS